MSPFLGLWYEQERYPALLQIGGRCNTAEFGVKVDGTISIMNRQESKVTGLESGVRGYAKPVYPGKLWARFPAPFKMEAPFYVVGTDYIHYAVIATCSEFGLLSGKKVWIYTRDRYPKFEIMRKAYNDLEHANLSLAFLSRTEQKHCEPVRPAMDPFENHVF